MLWKIYFWIISVLIIIALVGSSFDGTLVKYTFADWISLVISIPSFIGLYAFAYKKQFSTVRFWKVVLWITIFLDVYIFVYPTLSAKNLIPDILRLSSTYSGTESIIFLILDLPFLYVLYQLAYNPKWQQKEDKKITISLVNREKTVWWKVSAVAVFVYGLFYLIASGQGMLSEDRITLAILGLLQVIGSILLWYRVNLALFLAIAFSVFMGAVMLYDRIIEIFYLYVVVFIVLLITALKAWTKIPKA